MGQLALFNYFLVIVATVAITVEGVPGGRSSSKTRFIKPNLREPPMWVNDTHIIDILLRNSSYLDVTGLPLPDLSWCPKSYPVPKELKHEELVKSMLPKIQKSRLKYFIGNLSSYQNRHAGNALGKDALFWISSRLVKPLIKDYVGNLTVAEYTPTAGFTFEWYEQRNVIARIEGSDPVLRKEVIVVGAHADSMSAYGIDECLTIECFTRRSPGADDNGSGSSVVLEAIRVIVESGFRPRRTIEFHWYAAEEYGIRGSMIIASNYNELKKNVVGMLCFDVVGHAPTPESMKQLAIQQLDTNPHLNHFLKMLTEKYLAITWEEKSICKVCYSDYASWTYHGYPSAFPFESHMTPYLHTDKDTIDTVNFDYLPEFVKLAVAFIVEYGEASG